MPEISRGAAGRISLPKPLTSFIGRERELAQAKRLLAGSYLVTLTGPGGSGKTRLCIAVAAAVAGDYPDGAARVKLLPPEAILPRLDHSLGLLTGGGRDLPDRQQTLRATIAWSYDLLTEGARRLLAACSVFAGGASLEVIETVCDRAVDIGVLDGLQELVDQSLLRPTRFAMLETIREYAAERLDALPEAEQVRAAHAAAFLALVEADGRPHAGLARKEWLERVETEHNNIRAALSWYREHDPPAALRLAAAMSAFWSLRGHHTEGRQRLRDLLGLVPGPSVARVTALNGAAWLAIDQGDYVVAAGLLGESIGLSQALGDMVGESIATAYLGRCKMSGLRIAEAVPDVKRAVALANEAGDRPAIAFTTMYSALVAQLTGQLEAARGLFTRCAAMAAELGLAPLSARAGQTLAHVLLDLVVPALGRSPVIQRRGALRISQIYVSYPPGPLARQDGDRGRPRAGQRMPDIAVRAGGVGTTLYRVLRGGQHVLVVPAAHAAGLLRDAGLMSCRRDLNIVTPAPGGNGTGSVVLVRPDGHVAARGSPGRLEAVTGYLRDLFTEPDGGTRASTLSGTVVRQSGS
jgi:non-specific serine/threonine protein kinase